MDIGVFGGTFDPIHSGHLAVAEEARARLNLADVLFIPSGQPWLKPASPIAAVEHRLEMVRLALTGKPHFKLSTMEIERTGPSYAVDTIAELQRQLGSGNDLFFILGWGSLVELSQWKEPTRLVGMCRLVAAPRPGNPVPDLQALEAVIPGLSERVIILDKPEIDVSATGIRELVARGLSIENLVPEAVEKYSGTRAIRYEIVFIKGVLCQHSWS